MLHTDFFAEYKLQFDDPEDCNDVIESVDKMIDVFGELSRFITAKADALDDREQAPELLRCLVQIKTDVLDYIKSQATDNLEYFQTHAGCNTDCPRYAKGDCPHTENPEKCPRNTPKVF